MWVLWVGFLLAVVVMLALDLGLFHRKAHVVRVKEALVWTGVWIALALVFNVFVYFAYEHHWFGAGMNPDAPDGRSAAVLYFTGYVVEKMLSVDNVFVIALIFSYFGVPAKYQHRVLFWGIVGALVMRAGMIVIGAALIARFHWILYIFGAFLILTALKMLLVRHEADPARNLLVRLARQWFPVSPEYHGQCLMVRLDGKLMLTPLALALVAVESTDVMFAVDSIPAIFAITDDPFLVFTSNVFAILGLRSLYFALADMMDKLRYLKLTLAVLLALIGVKMLLKDVLHAVPGITYYTLGTVAVVLSIGVVASLVHARRASKAEVAVTAATVAPAPKRRGMPHAS
jgi:tellurite resistance protein TerC